MMHSTIGHCEFGSKIYTESFTFEAFDPQGIWDKQSPFTPQQVQLPIHYHSVIPSCSQCLNVLVAAGAAGADNKQLSSYKAIHSCACTPGDARVS